MERAEPTRLSGQSRCKEIFVQKCQWLAIGLLSSLIPLMMGCSSSTEVDSLSISPATQSLSIGQTAQFTATSTTTHGHHPATTQDVTAVVTWTSSSAGVASIDSKGVATAVAPGSATITASMSGFGGLITTTATVSVTGTSGGGGGGGANPNIVSISVIPNSQSVASPGQTSQFIAIGTNGSGGTVDLSNKVTWSSSSPQIATITNTGVATAVSQGTSTITALYTNASDGTVATGTGTFAVAGGVPEQITGLTIYPGSQSLVQSEQTQFFVVGTQGTNGLQTDVTKGVAWTSTDTNVGTIGSAGNGTPGLATAVGAGSTTITATWTNPDKTVVVATATLAVTIGATQEPLISINIVPGGATVSNKGMSAQFMAFGTYSTNPTTRDITNSVTWVSLMPEVAEIDSCGAAASGPDIGVCPNGGTGPIGPSGGLPGEYAGLATSMGATGDTVIYAIDNTTNPDGTVVVSNPQQFTCMDPKLQYCIPIVPTPQLATVTVFIEGEQSYVPSLLNPATNLDYGEYVTAPTDTGTPNLIHCGREWTDVGGAGGQVCTGTYEPGAVITLTEDLPPGDPHFGGWSTGSGCVHADGTPLSPAELITSTTCTLSTVSIDPTTLVVTRTTGVWGNLSAGVIFY